MTHAVAPIQETTHPEAMEERRGVPPIQIAVLAALLLALFWGPVRYHLIKTWMQDPNWSQGWIIPLFSLYCIYDRREQLRAAPSRHCWWGLLILAASQGMYLYFLLADPRAYPRSLAIVPAILGLTLFLSGWAKTRILAFPILFLALAIPIPQGWYIALTFPLRQMATFMASAVLPLIAGVETELGSGTVIDYYYQGGRGTLNVEEACSGMRSIMGIVTLGFVMAYLGNRPNWQRVIMVASCIPIAIVCNWLRVVITGVLYITGHQDLARGTPHALLGMAMFVVALGLFAMVGLVLSRIFVEVPDAETSNVPAGA